MGSFLVFFCYLFCFWFDQGNQGLILWWCLAPTCTGKQQHSTRNYMENCAYKKLDFWILDATTSYCGEFLIVIRIFVGGMVLVLQKLFAVFVALFYLDHKGHEGTGSDADWHVRGNWIQLQPTLQFLQRDLFESDFVV
jgi:hypothetical protein